MRSLVFSVTLLALAGCHARRGTSASLLAAHSRERAAHVSRDAESLVALLDEPLVELSNGRRAEVPRADSRARFTRYFDGRVFERWDDLAPPRLWIADDGTLGAVAVMKEVVSRPADGGAAERTVFAWLETWRWTDDGWRLVAMASTREPGP